jgi:hydroxymethylbilane synthase
VRTQLRRAGLETERIELKTTGDLAPDIPLSQLGSRAIFTKQIDDALIQERIDLAVHSLKDLPTELPQGISIAAIGVREDPRDALVSRQHLGFDQLPRDAVLATSSLRRRAQLLHRRPEMRIVELRGNVDTRLAKLDGHQEWNAIVLATAGLVRLGLEYRIGERLSPEVMLPAPGQGALAVTVRVEDVSLAAVVRQAIHDPTTAIAVAAERSFLRRLEGGCQVPVAAFAQLDSHHNDSRLRLDGRVIALDGSSMIEGHDVEAVRDEESAAALGAALAERLLARGADTVLAEARAAAAPRVTEP